MKDERFQVCLIENADGMSLPDYVTLNLISMVSWDTKHSYRCGLIFRNSTDLHKNLPKIEHKFSVRSVFLEI